MKVQKRQAFANVSSETHDEKTNERSQIIPFVSCSFITVIIFVLFSAGRPACPPGKVLTVSSVLWQEVWIITGKKINKKAFDFDVGRPCFPLSASNSSPSVLSYGSCDGPGLCGYDLHENEGVAWGQEGKYSTTLFTQRARKILESHDPTERPLFLLLSLQVSKKMSIKSTYVGKNVWKNDSRWSSWGKWVKPSPGPTCVSMRRWFTSGTWRLWHVGITARPHQSVCLSTRIRNVLRPFCSHGPERFHLKAGHTRTTAQTFFCFVLFIAEFSGQLCWFDVTAPGWKGLLKWSPMLSDKKRQKTKQKTGFIWFFSLCPPAREEKSNKQSWFLLLTSNLCTSSTCRIGFPGRWRGWGANSGCIS